MTFLDGLVQIAIAFGENKIFMRNNNGTWVRVSA
ncbi:pyocin knob domain-containing protein [Clostridium botulinum]|nr:pyocin knob domain-containing protein [Clostridium botulinum]